MYIVILTNLGKLALKTTSLFCVLIVLVSLGLVIVGVCVAKVFETSVVFAF